MKAAQEKQSRLAHEREFANMAVESMRMET